MKQLSVFVENKTGRLSAIANILKENNIDICALSLADTSEYGILRLIVDKPDEAVAALKENGVMVKITEVIASAMDDAPGGLAKLLDILCEAHVSVEYMYAFIGKTSGKAWTVFRVDDTIKAKKAFEDNNIMLYYEQEDYRRN